MHIDEGTPKTIVFYLVPEFTMLAFSSAVEALRLANQVIGETIYHWRLVSKDGEAVSASNGIRVAADRSLSVERAALKQDRAPFLAIVCGGKRIDEHCNKAIEGWLRECRRKGTALGALCTGSLVLAASGLLKEKRCTIHWENHPSFAERYNSSVLSLGIYEVDDGIYTCGGGAASFDMMLHLIGEEFGAKVTSEICQQALFGRIREKSERQRLPFSIAYGAVNSTIEDAVEIMETNLAERLSLAELASRLFLSRRQLERKFKSELGCSPARYYLKLRLERAKLLISQTDMPIVDIAFACGFVSSSHFCKCYRVAEGRSPQEGRNATRASLTTMSEPTMRH